MKKKIHINQHVIKANAKKGEINPVITVKTYKDNTYGHEVYVDGPCVIKYNPYKPLPCGAKVWIETDAVVDVWVREKSFLGSDLKVKDDRYSHMKLIGRK
jgi:hypothetical protein